jgi:alpha-tubulin suppressor-like RCC1 family protein
MKRVFGLFLGICLAVSLTMLGSCAGGDDNDDDNGSSCIAAAEICDGVDNDCDGQVDEGCMVAAGGFHTCALLASNGAWCCGANWDGQIGAGMDPNSGYYTYYYYPIINNYSVSVPAPVRNSAGMVSLSLGAFHSCALMANGGVKCWGANWYGQLGDNSWDDKYFPVDVINLTGRVNQVSAGGDHTCALLASGSVQCWGENSNGELGNNSWTTSNIPVQVIGLAGQAIQIAAGGGHTCALLASGSVQCWGYNNAGQLGNNTWDDSNIPVQVIGLAGQAIQIAAGNYHTCALLASGSVQCWGYNGLGELGNNTWNNSNIPVQVIGLSGQAAQVSAGGWHTCALLASGSVQCWGYNGYGQLGNNSWTTSNIPVQVIGLDAAVRSISAGWYHTCAFLASGKPVCWGEGYIGQLGIGLLGEERNIPVYPIFP